jgi:sulfatase maturation enzyme AslB (radical SAM superfamily)
MSRRVFEAALQLAAERGEYITFGGGEPTLHPKFWEFLGLAMAQRHRLDDVPYVITNGSETQTALALAELARNGALNVDLSQDEYHDYIRAEVVAAFGPSKAQLIYGRYRDEHDRRGIRRVTRIVKRGRAQANGIYTQEDACCCEDLFVSPAGKLFCCGCQNLPFGTVFDPAIPEDSEIGVCGRKQPANPRLQEQLV